MSGNGLNIFPKALPEARPEILNMLGNRRDEQALELITASLNDPDGAVRVAAAEAVAKISGKKAVPLLTGYMMKYDAASDQEAAKSALKSVSGSDEMPQIKPVLKDGSPAAKKSAIELMAWNKGHEYFTEILPYSCFI